MTEKTHMIEIRHETVWVSWVRDASTFALFTALIGVGVLLNSVAMQWAGVFVAIVTLIVKASGIVKKMTIAEARAYLDKLESGEADQ